MIVATRWIVSKWIRQNVPSGSISTKWMSACC